MFPLGMVLLPGGVLPLHVFEPRYRQMVFDLLESDEVPEFGQVLITRGTETGGNDQRAEVGTVARVVDMEAVPGGRYALMTVGTRRIRVIGWLSDDPYPRADTEDWPDEQTDDQALSTRARSSHQRVREVLGLAVELGDVSAAVADARISDDPVEATYHLATLAPVGEADRYRLLAAPGPIERLEVLDDVLDDVEAMLRFRLGDGEPR
jgi:Lon protease-like protein